MLYDHLSANYWLNWIDEDDWWGWVWLERKARRHKMHQKDYIKIRPKASECLFIVVYWSLTSPFVTVMDISATDRNPEPGDNPLLFSTDSKGSFRCTQPQTVMHTTKPLLNQLGTTGICPHRSNQPTQDSNPGSSDHESQTLCVSPQSEDRKHQRVEKDLNPH